MKTRLAGQGIWPVVVALLATGCGGELAGNELGEPGQLKQAVGTIQKVTGFGSNPGALNMYKYVPADMPANAPLVVAMHGCTQTANDYAQIGWNELADKYKFYVMYPEQTTTNNGARCFNWAGEYGDPTNTRRGEGENLSIKQMVDKMKADHSVDESRVFVTGFSGGGAQAALMLAVWPDVFAAGGIFAGIPYLCTTTFNEVSGCLSPGKNRTPAEWAQLVRNANPSYSGPYPRVAIWQGTSDAVVSPNNRIELVDQWTGVHGIDQTADVSETLKGHTRNAYKNANGQTLVELVEVPGMGHGVPVDPAAGCGTAGSYRLGVGICASEAIARFFGLTQTTQPGGDTQPPSVDITSPASGVTVSGQTLVQVSASDDVAVTKVEFYVGPELMGTDTSAPYEFAWDTTVTPNGSHTLKAVATDAAGNVGTDADTSVTVANSGPGPGPGTGSGDTTPPVTTAIPNGGDFEQEVMVVLEVNEPAVTYFTLDGNTPTTQSPVYVNSLKFVEDVTLKFFSVDTAGNHEKVQTLVFHRTANGAPKQSGSVLPGGCSAVGTGPGAFGLLSLLGLWASLRRTRRQQF